MAENALMPDDRYRLAALRQIESVKYRSLATG